MFREPRNSFPKVFIDPRVVVRDSSIHRWGCFATEDIEANILIESAPVVICHRDTSGTLFEMRNCRHILQDYPFCWKEGYIAFALGYAAIYNHLKENNCTWRQNFELETIEFFTKQEIKAGEEITVRYLPVMLRGALWFDDGGDGSVQDHLDVTDGFNRTGIGWDNV
tara:strand:- start:5501 stop:6001 length:501 start_codon:yes stop_codon:yes gene_type:complete